MYKYIITAILIAIFTGCSAPKPKHAPSWYTSPPKDFKYFYSTASGNSITHAKNKAIANMRKVIQDDIDAVFTSKTTKLKLDGNFDIKPILEENEHLVNTISFVNLKIEKSEKFNDQQLILLKIPRKSIFDKLSIISSKRFRSSKENYTKIKEGDKWIRKYDILNKSIKDFAKLASITEAKRVTLNSFDNRQDINYLNQLLEEYLTLKNEISVFVVSDINSRIYVKGVKNALYNSGLELSKKPKSDKSLKLFITSTTKNVQDYGFNRSSSLVKYTTYDLDKNVVAFRQHTFSAKSRRSYTDAKVQTINHQKSMIKKLGIFDFIGVK